jgi:hypothetical protein
MTFLSHEVEATDKSKDGYQGELLNEGIYGYYDRYYPEDGHRERFQGEEATEVTGGVYGNKNDCKNEERRINKLAVHVGNPELAGRLIPVLLEDEDTTADKDEGE